VEAFAVEWEKGISSDPTMAKLSLTFSATFKKDDRHDPALADFRQNAFHKLKITAGPHKGDGDDNSPLHDDNYSRADDIGNHTMDDIYFVAGDQPGPNNHSLHADDVIDFRFTAEQMIIDLSRDNKVIAKRGPYTARITGKDPRKFHNVRKLLDK
jgi:hypothetical protein